MQEKILSRQQYVDSVLSSTSAKKIVVAGPGTGKTFLFRQALKGKTKTLTLTFVNSLVEDLSLELQGMSEVRTLHGFARSMLKQLTESDIKLFPKLEAVIREDSEFLLGQAIAFNKLFHDRQDDNEHIKFYSSRRRYYDKHFGYSDVVYALVLYLEKYPDKVPSYEQVVVDEFQDFNKLEVDLIELLATKSPVLIAGDDDQALYDFKQASALHIRHRYSNERPEYAPFTLPYCSRCTRVIVDATNDVIAAATANGHLKNRIPKDFRYHNDDKKDAESNKYPTIGYKHAYAKQIPWFIQSQIEKIAADVREQFSVLIICPTSGQCARLADGLEKKGFENIDYVPRRDDDITLLDGLKVLLEDKTSNLGWRIVAKKNLEREAFNACLEQSNKDGARPFVELLGEELRKKIESQLACLKDMAEGEEPDPERLEEILADTELAPHFLAASALQKELESAKRGGGNAGIRKIPLKITTVQSSKGLAKDYVFICFFDDQYFLTDGAATDKNICNCLVAMTRARRKLCLISSRPEEPLFLKWIDPARIQKL